MVIGLHYLWRGYPLDFVLQHVHKATSTFIRSVSIRWNPFIHRLDALLHLENDESCYEA